MRERRTEEQIPARYSEQNHREPVPPAAPHAHVAAQVFMRGGISESHFLMTGIQRDDTNPSDLYEHTT